MSTKFSKYAGIAASVLLIALGTALNTSYFAASVGLFAIIVGIALLLIGTGLLVLTLRLNRDPKPTAAPLRTPAAPIAPVAS